MRRVCDLRLRRLLRSLQEEAEEEYGDEDTDRVSDHGVVDRRALCSLLVHEATEALRCEDEVGRADGAHEGRRYSGDPVVLLLAEEVHRGCPEDDHRKGLVGPAEVTPYDGVVELGNDGTGTEYRDRQH